MSCSAGSERFGFAGVKTGRSVMVASAELKAELALAPRSGHAPWFRAAFAAFSLLIAALPSDPSLDDHLSPGRWTSSMAES